MRGKDAEVEVLAQGRIEIASDSNECVCVSASASVFLSACTNWQGLQYDFVVLFTFFHSQLLASLYVKKLLPRI